MPISPAESRSGTLVLALVGTLLTGALAGCAGASSEPSGGGQPSAPSGTPTSATAPPVAVDVVEDLVAMLRQRQRALRRGDQDAFLEPVDGRSRAEQATYFTNLRQLPLETYRLRLDRATVRATDDGYEAVVNVSMRLAGFDAERVTQPELFRFVGSGDGDLLLASSHDPDWTREAGAVAQPWDRGPIQVRARGNVLGIFDDRTVGRAEPLLTSVARAIADVQPMLETEWRGTVVVYALSSDAFLRDLSLPTDADRLDAVTFPVATAPGDSLRASTRIALHPSLWSASPKARDRVLRHEIAHVSIGSRAVGVPTWLSEGIAEYVAADKLPIRERSVSRGAVDQARRGLTGLPDDQAFGSSRAGANYGIAWYAVAYLATNYGPYLPYDLLTALHLRSNGESVEAVLDDYTGLTEAELAREAGRMIKDTYR